MNEDEFTRRMDGIAQVLGTLSAQISKLEREQRRLRHDIMERLERQAGDLMFGEAISKAAQANAEAVRVMANNLSDRVGEIERRLRDFEDDNE